MPKKDPGDRLRRFRENAARKGWKRRDYYATEGEHEQLAKRLYDLRGKGRDGEEETHG